MAKAPKKPRRLRMREVLAGLGGARLCYGKPIEARGRTVVPVASVRARGGFGEGADGAGGGGGLVNASPIGFIDVGPEGARFEPIRDPERTMRMLQSALATAGAVGASLAGVRALRRVKRSALPSPRRLLDR
jgi:hypothetical protein